MSDIFDTVKAHGQEQLLNFIDELDDISKATILEQIERLDWQEIPSLIENYVLQNPDYKLPENLDPAAYYPFHPETAEQREKYSEAERCGADLIRAGKLACFTVAGGQGTRLGHDGPKGSFCVSPIKNKSIFQLFAETILKYSEIYDTEIPWYIMTSPNNNLATIDFFESNAFFGLNKSSVIFFMQGQMPAIDFSGKMLLSEKDGLALSPDGHGGSLRALYQSGAIKDMAKRGVDYISYFQVDNPLIPMVDPLFLGLHHLDSSQMSNRMLAKRDPFEKLGLFCMVDDKMQVIEYSDLPDEYAVQIDENGKLRYICGSPAMHLIDREFIEELNQGGFSLPYHRAEKKVPYIDASGACVIPESPNAVKLETFVFDALPLASKALIMEADRACHFAPVKNKEGEDSPGSSRSIMQELHASWLAEKGVRIARKADGSLDCKIEISPLKAVCSNCLNVDDLPNEINTNEEFYLG
ncbi:MAG: UDPGP type 1 family protein [Lentisphaeria bacterium]|nr:UDPGP type 1 family protein [Lentisphaeria bacterium]NQZ66676.1 UDPGP type 1 family protein [Lentisphaeria bacterium]